MTTEKAKKPRTKKIKESITDTIITPTESTQLSLLDIKEDFKKFDELVRVEFPSGKFTNVYRYFKPVTIEKMLKDYGQFLIDYETTGKMIVEEEATLFLKLHIVLYFSTLIGEFPKDIYEKMDVFEQMANHDLVKKTLFSFDENEISKVYETIAEKFEEIQKLMKHNVEMKQQLKDKVSGMNLENKDIIMTMFEEGGEFA